MAKLKMIGVRVTEREYERVRRWATTRGLSVTDFVRQAIETMLGGPIEPAEHGDFEVQGCQYSVTSTEWVGRRHDRDEVRCLLVRVQRGSDGQEAAAIMSMSGPLIASTKTQDSSTEPDKIERYYLRKLPDIVEEVFAKAEEKEGSLYYKMFVTGDPGVVEELRDL